MNQLDLLSTGAPRHARARRTDPVSSHHAAAKIERTGTAAGHAERILAALERLPGSTCREIARATGIEYPAVSKRLRELVRIGKLRCAGPTEQTAPCAVLGERVSRWWPL